jgi:hypothetical protein
VKPIPPALRELVIARAAGLCEYCRLEQRSQVATFPLDHILPRSLGGLTDAANLALACPRCNALKWLTIEAMDPQTRTLTRLFNPRIDRWEDHFCWSPTDPAVVQPRTQQARATALLLELNSPARVEIRRWLAVLGRHPPPS